MMFLLMHQAICVAVILKIITHFPPSSPPPPLSLFPKKEMKIRKEKKDSAGKVKSTFRWSNVLKLNRCILFSQKKHMRYKKKVNLQDIRCPHEIQKKVVLQDIRYLSYFKKLLNMLMDA